jgi:hypothetical protein
MEEPCKEVGKDIEELVNSEEFLNMFPTPCEKQSPLKNETKMIMLLAKGGPSEIDSEGYIDGLYGDKKFIPEKKRDEYNKNRQHFMETLKKVKDFQKIKKTEESLDTLKNTIKLELKEEFDSQLDLQKLKDDISNNKTKINQISTLVESQTKNLEVSEESITRKIIQEIDLEDEAFNSFKNALKKEIMEELDITPAKEDVDLVIEDKEEIYTLEEVQEIIDYIRLVIFPINIHESYRVEYNKHNQHYNPSLEYYFPQKYEFSYKNNLYLSLYCKPNSHIIGSSGNTVFIIDKIKSDNITLLLIFLYLITVMLTKGSHNYTVSMILFSDNFFKYDDFKILEPYLEKYFERRYPGRTQFKKYDEVFDKLNKDQKFKIESTNVPLVLDSEVTYKYLIKTIENFPNIGNNRFQEKIQKDLDYILN